LKTKIALIWVLILTIFNCYGQSIVVHKDLLSQLAKNESVKTTMHTTYDSTLSGIQKARKTVTDAAGAIEIIQQTVFNSLTNVSDGIKSIRTITYISKYSLSILNNVSTAISIAADKPYLADIVSKEAILFYERLADLTGFVSNFILNENTDQLVKPTERDRFLYTVYRQTMALDAISSNLCANLKKVENPR